MLKTRLLLFILLGFATFAHAQTLLSPDAYLGYKLGSKFTAHHKIVAYFEAVANAVPQQIKLEKYALRILKKFSRKL
jgi:hypothetical protein